MVLLASVVMATMRFDLRALGQAVENERERRDLSLAALSRQIGVSSSTLRRFGQADDAEADGVLAAIRWLGAMPEEYVTGGGVVGKPLPSAEAGYVRVDMRLVAEAEGVSMGSRTRTTIQRLVAAAAAAGQPVAALTRVSEV